jgi:hypothetical protein
MERNRFLVHREIEELQKAVALAFGLHRDSVLVSIEEREIEIRETFGSAGRRKTAQVIIFKASNSPGEDILEIDVARAFPSRAHRECLMPGLVGLIFAASRWEDPHKLQRISIDYDLVMVEFRRPIDGWEATDVILCLAVGSNAKTIDHDDPSNCMWFAVFYEHPQ